MILWSGRNLRILLIEVLLYLGEVFLRSSNQPAFPQGGLSLFLAGKVVRERWSVLGANHWGRLDGRRRYIELPCGGRSQFVRKLLEETRRGGTGKKSVTKAPLDWDWFSCAPGVVICNLFLEHSGWGRRKWFHFERLTRLPEHRWCKWAV